MFNRDNGQQISEARIAEIERVVTQHGEMLNSLRDHIVDGMDLNLAIFAALTAAIVAMPEDQRNSMEFLLSTYIRSAADREEAARLKEIFEQRLQLNISA